MLVSHGAESPASDDEVPPLHPGDVLLRGERWVLGVVVAELKARSVQGPRLETVASGKSRLK